MQDEERERTGESGKGKRIRQTRKRGADPGKLRQ